MPTSGPQAISAICSHILHSKPKTALDIGVGSGKFGFLLREYTDNWGTYFNKNKIKVHGIEAFPRYLKPIHNLIYDKIFKCDALEILPQLEVYDMIIMADVLEHFTYQDGIKIMNLIVEKSKKALIALPVSIGSNPQQDDYGNKYERHLYCWSKSQLEVYGEVKTIQDKHLLIVE